MDLRFFDNKCVRIIDTSGEVYEGTASYLGREYVFHEYGRDQEALCLTPIMFCENDISSVVSLEDVNGPFGHYSEKYGLLERTCLESGTDLIGEILDSDDDIQILRMLDCINDSFKLLADRAVPGMALWRSGMSMKAEESENGNETVYLGELENMLGSLVIYNKNSRVVSKAKDLLNRISEYFHYKD